MMDVDEDLHELSVPDVEDESMSMETQATPVLVTSKPTQVQARVNNKPKVPSPDELSRPEDPNTARPRSNNGLRAVGPYAPHFDAQLQKREPRGTPSVSPSPVASQECALAILAGGVAQPAQAVRGPEGMTLRSRPLPYAPSSHTTVAAAIRTQPSEPQPAVAAQPEPPKKKSGRGGRRAGAGRPPKRKRKLPETAAVAPATPAPTVVPSAADNAQAVLTSAVGGPTPESSGRALRPRQLASKTVLPPSSQGSPSIAYSQAELAPVEIKKSNISGCCEGSGRKRKARTELPRPGGGNPPGPPAIHTPTTEAAGSSTNGSSSQEATLFSSIFARWLAASSASVANGPGPGSKIGGTGASIRTGTGTFWREISVMDNLRLLSDVGSSPPYFPITPAAQSPTAALDDLRASETGRNDNSPSSSKLYGPAHTIFPRSPSAHQEEDSDLGSPAFENGWSKDDGDHIDAKSHGSASPVRPRAASVSPAQQTPDAADDNLASPGVSSDSTIVVDSSQSTISLDSPHARTHAGPGADASPTASPDTELLDLVPSAPGSVSSSASSSDGPQPSPDVEHEPESRQPSEEATSPKSSGEENSQKRPAEDEAAGQSPQKLQKTLTYSSARFASQAADVPLPAAGNGNAPSKPQLSSGSERRLLQPSCQVPPGRWTTGGFVMNLPPAPPTTRVRAYKPRSTMGGRNDASWPMGLEPPATPTRAPVETPDKRSTLPSSSAADVSLPLSELKSLPPTPCPPPKAALPQAKPVPDSRPVLTGLPSKPVQPVPVERSIPASPAMSAFPAVPPRPAVNAASASLSTIRRDPSVGPIAPSLGSDISRGPVRASESYQQEKHPQPLRTAAEADWHTSPTIHTSPLAARLTSTAPACHAGTPTTEQPPSHTHRAPVETSLPPRPKRPSPAQRISIPGLGSYSDWHRYTPEEDAQIVALHQRGLSFQKIAPRIGGRHTWNSVATHFNLYLRDGGAGKRRREKREADKATRPADGSEKKERVPWKSWTEAEQRRLLELKSMGMSNEAVGDVIGRTYNAVRLKYHDIRKNGISVDDGNEEQER
ncbi:hypothetical protein B0T17DRAFT_600661 [Bombardia bombarda]|uniref:Uncharacterized protein n=1 Tax=Bombardia bombarda TaxID=252184 RepID=A0AA39WUX7_9PEZI|nr:hypothetical protein B0T17DRAFT_600661 [Bombardia bombarda]